MKQARVLTDAEFKRLMAVVSQRKHAARDKLAIMLSHFAGLRVGEIAALKVSDIIDGDGKPREQLRLSAEITKGGYARVVFLNDKLRREIGRYQVECLGEREADCPLLMTQKKTAFSANTLCQLMAQIYASAGLEGATSHSGRRWFITRLAHSGVSPKVIMTLAGHKNLSTTQRYIDVRDEMMKAAVDLL